MSPARADDMPAWPLLLPWGLAPVLIAGFFGWRRLDGWLPLSEAVADRTRPVAASSTSRSCWTPRCFALAVASGRAELAVAAASPRPPPPAWWRGPRRVDRPEGHT